MSKQCEDFMGNCTNFLQGRVQEGNIQALIWEEEEANEGAKSHSFNNWMRE